MKQNPRTTRRKFVATTAALAATATVPSLSPANVHTKSRTDKEIVVGEGDFQYQVKHAWPELPGKYSWQTTHNVAVDSANNLYVIHEGIQKLKDHPSIFVFDPKGKFIRAFGSHFQGGGHGIEVRKEGTEEFLYVCGYQQVKSFEKMTLKGETVWKQMAPMASGVYAEEEDTKPEKKWGRNRFMPTNFAFLDDGEFLLVDGYGSFYVHHYDKNGKWKRHFGGPGKGEGKFSTPHGIWVDNRNKNEPQIVICDRANHTIQFCDMEGNYKSTMAGFGLPANADTYKNLLMIPELHARVTLLDENNKVVARLGDDVNRITSVAKKSIRGDSKKWLDGKFVHPHDACFDKEGNILVAEWVRTGRISKLTRV